EMQQWYMKAFDATLRPGQTDFFIGADLPGVGYSLNFFRWEGDQSITHVPTAGRVVDHVGFEVKNLEAFCKALEAKGIKITRPYQKKDAAMNSIATATIIDPWGVSIELTEGLDKIRGFSPGHSCRRAVTGLVLLALRAGATLAARAAVIRMAIIARKGAGFFSGTPGTQRSNS